MSEERTIKLNEKRYSFRTIAKEIGLTETTVYNRAKRLGIDTRLGLTAKEAKLVKACYSKNSKKCTQEELRKELEGMK